MLGQIIGGIGSVIGAGLNFMQQNRQFEFDREMQEKTWAREDNAVQRRAADLEAAGLSPTLAAGGAAQAQSPIRAQVPGAGIGNQVMEAMQFQSALARQKQDIATSASQAALNNIQRENAELSTMPLKEALNSNYMVPNPNGDGPDLTPAQYIGTNYLLGLRNQEHILSDNAIAASWTAQKAIADAKASDLALQQKQWDFDITKQTGMRSYDTGYNAPLESVIRSLGGDGTPYSSALIGLLEKILKNAPKSGAIRGGY